jgi:hypothetical protein
VSEIKRVVALSWSGIHESSFRPRAEIGILGAVSPSHPRVPKTTIAAIAVIVGASAAMASAMQAAQMSSPSAITIVDPHAPGDGSSPPEASAGAVFPSPATVPGPSPGLVSGRPSGAAPGSPIVPGRTWNATAPGGRTDPGAHPTSSPTTGPGSGADTGSLIWDGRPAGGRSQFAALDCAKPGSLMIENDLRFGPTWVFDKPAGDDQCEAHGIAPNKTKYDFSDNSTYYFSWWSKVSSAANNDADFQWRSSGGGSSGGGGSGGGSGAAQDYPFVISAHNGHAMVSLHQAIWTSLDALTANTWHHYVVGIHTSETLTDGWIQLWYDGKPQTFANGSTRYVCRTWNGDDDPKWGELGAQAEAVTNYVSAPKVGTSYNSVAS